jgi:signal transduction histidine kinase
MPESMARRLDQIPWWYGDVAVAVTVIGFAVVVLVDTGRMSTGESVGLVALLAWLCVCAAGAHRWPLTSTVLACPVLVVSSGTTGTAADEASAAAVAVVFLLAYRLGSRAATVPSSVVAVGFLLVWLIFGGGFNPFVVVDTLGPWVVGVAVRARVRAQAELEQRSEELAREQRRQAEQSVRYERVRIARELHDIVAHSVSVMVVQASAGQYLAGAAVDDVLDAITEQADQATGEVARLFALLDPDTDSPPRSLDELVGQARSGGLTVRLRDAGAFDRLPPKVFEAVFRLVQEALTNAIKHAPGAMIEISLEAGAKGTELVVRNGPPLAPGLGLSSAGGGRGIAGMRERVARLEAGPTTDGGWQVRALLPAR